FQGDVGEPGQLAGEGQVHLAVVPPEGVLVVRLAVEGYELDHRPSPPWPFAAAAAQRSSRVAKLLSSFAKGKITWIVEPSPIRSPSSLSARHATWTRLRSCRRKVPSRSTRMPGRAEAR